MLDLQTLLQWLRQTNGCFVLQISTSYIAHACGNFSNHLHTSEHGERIAKMIKGEGENQGLSERTREQSTDYLADYKKGGEGSRPSRGYRC